MSASQLLPLEENDVVASGDLSQGSRLLKRISHELGRVDLALQAEVYGDR